MEVENTGEEAPGDVSRASQARESVAVEDQAEQPSQLEERNGKGWKLVTCPLTDHSIYSKRIAEGGARINRRRG